MADGKTRHRVARRVSIACMAMALVGSTVAVTAEATTVERKSGARAIVAREDAPNVLIIVTDDQRPDMMDHMPRTQRLFGRRGVRFERAFATTPVCCPFRASLMTGQYAHNSGVRRNNDRAKLNHGHTIQRYLHEGGYRTALLGKFLNGWRSEDPPPYFERFVLGSGYYRDRPVNVDGRMRNISQYLPYFLGKRAKRVLEDFERDDADPWLMIITPSSPHSPATPAPGDEAVRIAKWLGNPAAFEEDLSDKPPMLYPNNTPDGVEAIPGTRAYNKAARALMGADRLVQRVFKTVNALGEGSNTLAFFMSDNGLLMGEHGLRLKRYPYPMSQEIPLFMRWPAGGVPKGETDDRIVANIDVLPTVLEAAGLDDVLVHDVDGLSLHGSEQRNRLLLEHFSESHRQVPSWASLITDEEQYTEYYDLDEETVTFTEYYDTVADPWRLTNVLGDDDPLNDPGPATLLTLRTQLAADRACAGSNCP